MNRDTSTTPVRPSAPPPLSVRGYRVADLLALAIFALGVYAAFRNGTPLPAPPVLAAPPAEAK